MGNVMNFRFNWRIHYKLAADNVEGEYDQTPPLMFIVVES